MEEKEIQDSSKYKKLEDKKYKKGITLKRFILLVFAIVMKVMSPLCFSAMHSSYRLIQAMGHSQKSKKLQGSSGKT